MGNGHRGAGIKHSLGKLDLKVALRRILELIDQSGLTVLLITTNHILTNTTLEFHHRDPFDRLMIAQAKSEGLTVVSSDGVFKDYNIELIWKR
ncbi:MAG: type II toxin-antitoxin system VapC family toxin [Tunicatimonas sp.]